MEATLPAHDIDDQALVLKAAKNAAGVLGISLSTLSDIVGTRRETFSRPTARLDRKQTELALLVIRTARDLHAITGGDRNNMRHWITTPNRHVGGVPQKCMTTVDGLVRVVRYLDAMRAKA